MEKGFTIIELVLTILIVSIVSLAAVPFILNVGSFRSEAAARRLASDLSYARMLARSRNGTYGISFDPPTNSYTVYFLDPVTAAETPVIDPQTRTAMVIDLDQAPGVAGVDLQNANFGGTPSIRFTPQGIPQDGNGVGLAAAGSVALAEGGVVRQVVVQPETSEVSLQ